MRYTLMRIIEGEDVGVSVAILAGGQSRRMLRDKALVRLAPGEPTLIEMVAVVASELSDDLMIIAPHERGYGALLPGWRVLQDLEPGDGPAGGVITALRSARENRVLVLPCDAPLLSLPLLRMLFERAADGHPVVPWREGSTRQGQGVTLEVLHAAYPVSALRALEEGISTGERRLYKLVERAGPVLVPPEVSMRYDPGLKSFQTLNSPDELAEVGSTLFGRASAGLY